MRLTGTQNVLRGSPEKLGHYKTRHKNTQALYLLFSMTYLSFAAANSLPITLLLLLLFFFLHFDYCEDFCGRSVWTNNTGYVHQVSNKLPVQFNSAC